MTYHNCKKLLKHYNDLADGTIPAKHNRWGDVIANAKVRAKDMQERVDWYESDDFRVKHNLPAKEVQETKSKGKKDAKRPT